MMLSAVAVAGGSGSTTPPVYALTLGSQADALGLTGTQFAAPSATKNGVPITITAWAWTVTGPCTLDDDEIEHPTPTHTGAGYCTRQLAATLADGAVVYSAMDGWLVGDADGYIHSHLATWATEAAGAITTTRVADGVTYTKNDSGTTDGTLTVGATGLVMDSNTDGVAIQWPATSGGSRTLLQSDDVVWYAATDASVGTNGDILKLGLLNAAGTEVAQVEIGFTGGARRMVARRILAGTPSNYYKAEASHVRVIALRRIGAQSYEVRYSTTAYAGTWPLFSAMTEVIPGGTVSGRFTVKDNPPGDTGAGSTVTADPILWDATSVVRLAAVGTDRAIAATGIKWRPGA